MTRATSKGKGLGRAVTTTAPTHLERDGYSKAVLYVTQGNESSEALFAFIGAERVQT